jgi:hypothetical protein
MEAVMRPACLHENMQSTICSADQPCWDRSLLPAGNSWCAAAVRYTCAPPFGSSSIFSIDRGPSVVLMMSDTACICNVMFSFICSRRGLRIRRACSSCSSYTPWQLRCCRPGPCGPAPVLCLHSEL